MNHGKTVCEKGHLVVQCRCIDQGNHTTTVVPHADNCSGKFLTSADVMNTVKDFTYQQIACILHDHYEHPDQLVEWEIRGEDKGDNGILCKSCGYFIAQYKLDALIAWKHNA